MLYAYWDAPLQFARLGQGNRLVAAAAAKAAAVDARAADSSARCGTAADSRTGRIPAAALFRLQGKRRL